MISVTCLVDNMAQRGSALWGEHGLSFSIQSLAGKVLFDTGQSGEVLVHNADQMGISLDQFDALAFSHAHYDHTGGLESFLAHNRLAIPLYAHPDLLQKRFSVRDGLPRFIGLNISPADLSRQVNLQLNAEPQQILPGLWTTGEIYPREELEGRSVHHFIHANGEWLPDPYRDDLALVLEAQSGLVLICGCCHAGLLNTLAHVRHHFAGDIQAIIGGLHLVNATAEDLDSLIATLHEIFHGRIPKIYPNHCSEEQGYFALKQAFGDLVQPCPVGTVLNFNGTD
jgi:7,8-dihydropterin-6-yl-methyl-4-(beta-D-ribofuranosyl)aminobenzene 5'-phosphate synthase